MCILLSPEYFRTGVYSIRVIQCGAKSVEILLRIFILLRWAIRSSGETELPEIFKLLKSITSLYLVGIRSEDFLDNFANSALAALRSAVSNPSVNQP